MTLHDLTSSATLQGNININIWEDGDEVESRYFKDQIDFDCYCNDCDDVEDCEITHMYSENCNGVAWMVIDVSRD